MAMSTQGMMGDAVYCKHVDLCNCVRFDVKDAA